MEFALKSKSTILLALALGLFAIFFIGISSKFLIKGENNLAFTFPTKQTNQPTKLSGWIPWWDEDQGIKTAIDHSDQINSVSPVWFMVDENYNLKKSGVVNQKEETAKLKSKGIKVLPTLGTEISQEELSKFLNNKTKRDKLAEDLVSQTLEMGADGVDIDLEGIKKDDKNEFSLFLAKLSTNLKKKNLYLSITVHAQTGKVEWDGVEGQDLRKIGRLADEVRLMTYDEHSGGTPAGSISSLAWIIRVVNYNSKLIDKNKLVIGIPSYGYLWTKDDSKGLQYDEFQKELENKNYEEKRDPLSGEINYKNEDFSGWLSDSSAMRTKIKTLKVFGYNKFVIWHLGGLDEKFFDNN